MKKAKIDIVVALGGKREIGLFFKAEEVQSNSGYGNDKYIAIEFWQDDDTWEMVEYLDCRYVSPYNFCTVLLDFFADKYGDRLLKISLKTE